ncbi:MAG: CDP-glycerol glycerophosphotransferase family protein, partial [Bacilli bacterium]|nr:CDP-glycerol glycerophosphotransferase family protein [Bacilli bacterium]
MNNNYIWLFGENESKTANNNSFYFWKKVINIEDNIDKYLVLTKNASNQKVYKTLSKKEQSFVLWKNSIEHYKKYMNADMLFVTLSYLDVTPTRFFGKKVKLLIKKPVIYLQHGTLGIKKIGYKGNSYNNNMFRFCIYNSQIREKYKVENNFKDYQLYYSEYHPRYSELLRKNDLVKNKKEILWFITWREYIGDNIETELLIRQIKKVVNSEELIKYLERNDLTLKVCTHREFINNILDSIIDNLKTERIVFASANATNVMEELANSKLLITDYSSVGFDFTFLNKPVVLFQPDLDNYLKKRELYCDIAELDKYSIKSGKKLVEYIQSGKYEINNFFRSRLPKNIDYDFVRAEKHIIKMYDYFANLQNNKVTFLGYNFFGVGGTINATRALAEGLLENGFLVELLSLKKTGKATDLPYGLNINYIYYGKTKSLREKVVRNLHRSHKNYSHLNYDCNRNLLHPYSGYKLTKLMTNIRTNTLASTRESLHLFLNDCTSKHVKNKIYFFHTAKDSLDILYPGIADELKKLDIPKAVFVTEKNRLEYKKRHLDNYADYIVLGNTLEQSKIITKEEIKPIMKKSCYRGIYLVRISKERKEDLNNLINFGVYVKEHNIKNIIVDVYGTGNYVDEFLDELEDKDVMDIIQYKGLTTNIKEELENHDLMIDFSINHSFGMTYIEAVLNGKKVFCMKNPGSLEVMENIPNTYFESYEDLCHKISKLDQTTKEE